MTEKQLIDQFFESLAQSGLPADRQEYWAEKMASPDFNETDEQAFEAEIRAHIEGLEKDIDFLKVEADALEQERAELMEEVWPPVAQMAKDASARMEAEFRDFKEGVLSDEKEANDQIEQLRSEQEQEEIDKLRKGLGNS